VIRRNAGRANARIVDRLAAQVHLLRGLFPRHTGRMKLLRLCPEVAEVGLPVLELGFAGERAPVAGQHRVEVQTLQRFDGRDPIGEERVAHVRPVLNEQVAGGDDALLRQVDDDIPGGVSSAEEHNPNFP